MVGMCIEIERPSWPNSLVVLSFIWPGGTYSSNYTPKHHSHPKEHVLVFGFCDVQNKG